MLLLLLTAFLFPYLLVPHNCLSVKRTARLSLSAPSRCNDSCLVQSTRLRLALIASANGLQQQQSPLDQRLLSTNLDAQFSRNSYEATIGLGTNPVRYVKLAIDSGSELTWLQCQPCQQCFSQQGDLYDPRTSPSYRRVGCDKGTCMLLGKMHRRCREECLYKLEYKDGSRSSGELGQETLVFDSFSSDFHLVQQEEIEIFFGCGVNNAGTFGTSSGILGLGRGPLSIASQLRRFYGDVFVTCFPRALDPSSPGYLQFGSSGIGSGMIRYTPFYSKEFYSVKLEAITVAGKRLDAISGHRDIGTVVDSGSTITALDSELFIQLEQALQGHLGFHEKVQDEYLDLCFRVSDRYSGKNLLHSLPDIVFHFTNVDLPLTTPQKIIRVDNERRILCLAFMDNRGVGFNVFGAIQQQQTLVVYDLENERIGFAPGDC